MRTAPEAYYRLMASHFHAISPSFIQGIIEYNVPDILRKTALAGTQANDAEIRIALALKVFMK